MTLVVSIGLLTAIPGETKKSDLAPSGRAEFDALITRLGHQTATRESQAYLKATVAETQKNLMQTVLGCVTLSANPSWPRTRFVLQLDATGAVKAARAETDTTLAVCLEKRWVGMRYKEPPFAPFYRLVILEPPARKG